VATLKTHHGGGAVGQQVHDLTLAFIPPLGTDDNNILAHEIHSLEKFKTVRVPGACPVAFSQ
jgi:hypothetical protein